MTHGASVKRETLVPSLSRAETRERLRDLHKADRKAAKREIEREI